MENLVGTGRKNQDSSYRGREYLRTDIFWICPKHACFPSLVDVYVCLDSTVSVAKCSYENNSTNASHYGFSRRHHFWFAVALRILF